MALENIPKGVFVTTGTFNSRSIDEFCNRDRIELVDGAMIVEGISEFPERIQTEWMERHASGDGWDTPSCPKCDVKMVVRRGRRGAFWGCPNFGRQGCRQKFKPCAFPIPQGLASEAAKAT